MTTVNAAQGVGRAVLETVDATTSAGGANAENILPDPVASLAMSSDPGAELAAFAVQTGQHQEANAQKTRDTEEKIAVSEDNQQVTAMHEKADNIRSAGLTEGLGMIGEGAFDVAAAGAMTPDGKVTVQSAGFKLDGAVFKAGSTINGAASRAAEANADADADAAKSASDQAKGAAEDDHDAKTAAGALVSAALDFYREYTSAQASAKSAALHRA